MGTASRTGRQRPYIAGRSAGNKNSRSPGVSGSERLAANGTDLWRLREEVKTLSQAVKTLVRRLSELRSSIENSADERQAVTDCESSPAPGGRQSQPRLAPDEVAKLVAGYQSGRTI
ncbi:hypothetical protein GCM10027569_00260 [Flindersiella endophytica]